MKRPKTRIVVSFSLSGLFEPDEVTSVVGIAPSETWEQGENDPNLGLPQTSGWSLKVGPLYDADAINGMTLVSQLVAIIESKAIEINYVKKKFDLTSCLCIWVCSSSKSGVSNPVVGFSASHIQFLSSIGTSIDIDTYVDSFIDINL